MTVLVTGGTGYIGSHTCLELLEKGWDVVAVDNLSNSSPESLRRVSELTGRPLPFFPLDLRDETALGQIFGRYAFDGVIHFAGLKAVGESVAQPLEYYGNNLQSTVSLCRAMVRAGVGRVVFFLLPRSTPRAAAAWGRTPHRRLYQPLRMDQMDD